MPEERRTRTSAQERDADSFRPQRNSRRNRDKNSASSVSSIARRPSTQQAGRRCPPGGFSSSKSSCTICQGVATAVTRVARPDVQNLDDPSDPVAVMRPHHEREPVAVLEMQATHLRRERTRQAIGERPRASVVGRKLNARIEFELANSSPVPARLPRSTSISGSTSRRTTTSHRTAR